MKDSKTAVLVYLPQAARKKLKERADKDFTSVSAVARKLLLSALEKP